MNFKAQKVSVLVGHIKGLLEGEFRQVNVTGEISNLSGSAAGHYYFTLSDDQAALSCALFRMDAQRNPIIRSIKDGQQVLISGPISVYVKRGLFQLLAKRISLLGEGDLKARFDLLKRKLQSEGLFDLEQKKKIPILPRKIAVITSLKAAALVDFLNVMQRRCWWYHIDIFPAMVQGDGAAQSLVKALKEADQNAKADVIVITRGGGSFEDLWPFNDELLVREIANCKTPLISAVGHQVDFSLSDFAADLRCETPTAAAEILSQGQTQLAKRLDFVALKLVQNFRSMHYSLINRIHRSHPQRMFQLIQNTLYQKQKRFSQLQFVGRIYELTRLNEYQQQLDESHLKMTDLIKKKALSYQQRLERAHVALTNLNPNAVLKRGYAFVSHANLGVIKSKSEFDQTGLDEVLNLRFHDGVGEVKRKESL